MLIFNFLRRRMNMTTTYEKRTQSHEGRFDHVERDYSMEDVQKLSGSVQIEYTLAKNGANTLWNLLQTEDYVPTLGAMSLARFLNLKIEPTVSSKPTAHALSI